MTKRLSLGGRLRMAAACPDANAQLLTEAADAIEQHEAFRQEVSFALETFKNRSLYTTNDYLLEPFIIAKPDPLVEVLKDFGGFMPDADDFRAALEARGLEIRGKANDD